MITIEQFEEARRAKDSAQNIISEYSKQVQEAFNARWERFDKNHEAFNDEELVYAAHVRCEKCQAGMAHPKDCGPWHQWTCSNVLKGIGEDKGHQALPFAFYEVKEEFQPSANGATTRPQS